MGSAPRTELISLPRRYLRREAEDPRLTHLSPLESLRCARSFLPEDNPTATLALEGELSPDTSSVSYGLDDGFVNAEYEEIRASATTLTSLTNIRYAIWSAFWVEEGLLDDEGTVGDESTGLTEADGGYCG